MITWATLAVAATCSLALLIITQVATVGFFCRYVRHAGRARQNDTQPPAAVLLPLRGRDPFLPRTLTSLLNQTYPDYEVHVIVDSERDPAWQDLRSLLTTVPHNRLSVQLLDAPPDTCSLKSAALAQATERLDRRFARVVLVDSDVTPHATWLAELVAPLADESIGAATGYRWYAVVNSEWGTLVRHLWNVGGAVQVWLNGILWGGSLALSRRTIDEIGLVEAWRGALADDGVATRELRRAKRRVHFVPDVIMVNVEGISLGRLTSWIRRQLLAARTSGLGWQVVLLHALNLLVTHGLAATSLVAVSIQRDWPFAALLGATWAGYWLSCMACVAASDRAVHGRLAAAGRAPPPHRPGFLSRMLPGIVASHLVYWIAIVGASIARRVSWRGIEYQLLASHQVRRLNYSPFTQSADTHNTESVL